MMTNIPTGAQLKILRRLAKPNGFYARFHATSAAIMVNRGWIAPVVRAGRAGYELTEYGRRVLEARENEIARIR